MELVVNTHNLQSPFFNPLAGARLTQCLTRAKSGCYIAIIALRSTIFHATYMAHIAICKTVAMRISPELSWNVFKDHFAILRKALKTLVLTPVIAWKTLSPEQSNLRAQLTLFPLHLRSTAFQWDSILAQACRSGNLELFRQAVANGADVKGNADNLLNMACRNNRPLLIEQLAPLVNLKIDGLKYLWSITPDTLTQFVSLGFDINATDAMNRTILHKETRTDVIAKAIELGADVNAKDYLHRTPLHSALNRQNSNIDIYLTEKTDVNAQDNNGNSPLHLAASLGYCPVINTLAEKKANLELTNESGDTPLLVAIRKQQVDAVAQLIELQADVNVKDRQRHTPLDIVRNPTLMPENTTKANRKAMEKLLKDAGAQRTTLF